MGRWCWSSRRVSTPTCSSLLRIVGISAQRVAAIYGVVCHAIRFTKFVIEMQSTIRARHCQMEDRVCVAHDKVSVKQKASSMSRCDTDYTIIVTQIVQTDRPEESRRTTSASASGMRGDYGFVFKSGLLEERSRQHACACCPTYEPFFGPSPSHC